ncbi:MAG: response regulator [Selenomonadaceae bacterium]|uniref:Response regulator n=2 Tax=Selenomonadaceae TaxID=1843491 RepID=A0A6I2UM97_9FIRM|nr:response regulator [Selenomonadaceae bacterium]MSU09876.1 response regulator [Anaerovibrio slackiae]MBQ2411111.1 response regulator [Selenomonadaceae bacterium]MBQ5586661.1 response regulator [Selenomonadaceae bacterium]MBQ5651877.1 response regulator [Selenomonadaceae bacterium]
MVVDDSKISRMMISSMLAKTNFEVCAMAENAAHAIDLYAKTRPDVVTMDMNLPDADGIECSRRIHAMDSRCKIVMISAMKDAKLIMHGRLAGISSFLQKPVSTNELLDTLMILCQEHVGVNAVYRDSYVSTYAKVLQEGLQQIAGLESEIQVQEENSGPLSVSGVAVIIGIVGEPRGRVAFYMDENTMRGFAKAVLQQDEVTDFEAQAAVEESGNIIAGHGISRINDVIKDREMRLTPPGIISGTDIKLSNPELIAFNIKAKTSIGDIFMNIGFARSV